MQAAEYGCYSVYSWNLDAQLSLVRSLYTNTQFQIESLFKTYPNLLSFATTNDLGAAKAAFTNSANRYFASSQFIRNRSTNVVRLFNYAPDAAQDEQQFRANLADATNSLTHSVALTTYSNYAIFLGSHFSGVHPPASFLPTFRGAGFGLGTLPDLTFGGLVTSTVPATVEDAVEDFLSRGLIPIPTIARGAGKTGPQFHFEINTLKGRGYIVEVSSNLVDWQTNSAFFSLGPAFQFSDSVPSNFPRRYYRVADRTENMPRPANDNFASRIFLNGLGITASGYNASASPESGEPGGPWHTVWWSWTAQASGLVVASAVGGTTRHSVQVYTGNSVTNLTLVPVADALGAYFNGYPFLAVAGTTYQIQVDGEPGGIVLAISAPPTLTVTSPTPDVEYFRPTNVFISASANDPDGALTSLRIAGNGGLLAQTAGPSLSLTWSNLQSGVHWVEVVATDNLGITATSNLYVFVRPPNDAFANRIPIVGSSVTVLGTNSGATIQPGEPDHAGDGSHGSVWWSWTAPSSGYVTISADLAPGGAGHWPALLAVYAGGSISNLSVVASNAADFFPPAAAEVSFFANSGAIYQIAVDGRYGRTGRITLNVIPTRPPSVILVSPSDGETFDFPTNIVLAANAAATNGVINRVDFYDQYLGFIGTVTNFPYSLPYSPHLGSHTIFARATDNLGAFTISAPVSFQVIHPETVLSLNAPVYNLSGSRGSQVYYKFTAPPGMSQLEFQIFGGQGDCDIYVSYGQQPTLKFWDYRPYMHGNNESVDVFGQEGEWHIMLNGWDAYSGVTLQAYGN